MWRILYLTFWKSGILSSKQLTFITCFSCFFPSCRLGPSIPFRKSQLRIVVFQESERRGRQVLFDSANLRSRVRDEKPCDQSAVVPNGPPDATAKKSIPATKTQVPNGSTPSSLEEQRKTVAQVW